MHDKTKRLQRGYLRDYLSEKKKVDRSDYSIPLCEDSESGLVILAAMPRQLPRSLLQEMPLCFRNDPLETKERG